MGDYKQSHKYLKRLNECHFERSREIFNEAPEDFSTSLEMTLVQTFQVFMRLLAAFATRIGRVGTDRNEKELRVFEDPKPPSMFVRSIRVAKTGVPFLCPIEDAAVGEA